MATVLLATDGSPLATEAMAEGVRLLGADNHYTALAVVPPAFVPTAAVGPMDAAPMVVDPQLEREVEARDRAASTRDLDELAQKLGIEFERRIEIGEPGPTICAVASELDADVIVVGSHGHGWLQRVLIGSVSTHVLHHADRAVLVIRHRATV